MRSTQASSTVRSLPKSWPCALILVLGCFATSTRCQATTPSGPANGAAGPALDVQPQPAVAKVPAVAFPTDLLPVGTPGTTGTAPLGVTADELYRLTRKFFSNHALCLRALKNAASELGRKDVPVEPFFLYRFPITNEQYQVFIKAHAKTRRPPFHWWKWGGDREDFRKHQPEIAKLAKALEKQNIERSEAEIRYWEDSWRDLKFEIPKGTEKHPVVFVSYTDAVAFCGWAGMRLPTEAEWTYAATGGKRKLFLFGNEWDDDYPKKVGLGALRDRTALKPVGSLGPNAVGPFGHQDMVGQVWEWSLVTGYGPQTGAKIHDKEYEKLRRYVDKDKGLKKAGHTLPVAIAFNDDYAIAKGSGSIFSFSLQRWDELRVNVRAPLASGQTIEGLGFRAAKSYRAALDMTLSRLRAEYVGNQYFLTDQKLVLAKQDGIERYDLERSGSLITDYHAISFTPTNFLTAAKSLRPKSLEEYTKTKPVILGALFTTEQIKSPALAKGLYTVYYRHAGLPKILVDALREGCGILKKEESERIKAEKAAKRAKGKKKKPAKKKKDDAKKKTAKKKKKKGPTWRQIIDRYGFKKSDFNNAEGMVNKNFYKEVDYIYLKQPDDSRMKVPAAKNSLVMFRDNDGKWTAVTRIHEKFSLKFLRGSANVAESLVLTTRKLSAKEQKAGVKANETVEFHIAVPPTKKDAEQKSGNSRSVFKVELELTQPPLTGKTWRTNYVTRTPGPAAGNGNGKGKGKTGKGKSGK